MYDPKLHALILGHKLQYKSARASWLEGMIFTLCCQTQALSQMSAEEQHRITTQRVSWMKEHSALVSELQTIENSLNAISEHGEKQ